MRFGEFGKDRQIKNSPIWIIACVPMALIIQITKLKIRQYLLRANSPNLMLTKFSHYTVCSYLIRNMVHTFRQANLINCFSSAPGLYIRHPEQPLFTAVKLEACIVHITCPVGVALCMLCFIPPLPRNSGIKSGHILIIILV